MRLEAVFALMFGFWAHFLRQSRKKPGFPLQFLSPRKGGLRDFP
jgi:hypothetical protein